VPSTGNLSDPVSMGDAFHAFDLVRPAKETHKIAFFAPEESNDVLRLKALSFFAGVGFDAPLEIFTAPGPQAVATGRIPEKTK